MSEYNIPEIRARVRTAVTEKRFEHILGVAGTASMLGCIYGENIEKCEVTGLLHDCAKCYSEEELLNRCQSAGIALTEDLKQSPQLLHSIYGPVEASSVYGIRDAEILDAIRFHTTGRPKMSLLEQIVFAADYIEPHREQAKNLLFLRRLAVNDLNCCTAHILKDTIEYLTKKQTLINIDTLKAFDYYKKYL